MKGIFNNFMTSGFKFDELHFDIKNRYQMLNIGILLSTIGLIYGIIINTMRGIEGFVLVETSILCINLLLVLLLRNDKKYFNLVIVIMTFQFTLFFLFLIYFAEPESMKHLWLFTYPIILLYLEDNKKGLYWIAFLVFFLVLAPLQNYIEVKYSMNQITYLVFVLLIVHTIIYFYQVRIDNAKNKILEQQSLLHNFNKELEAQVEEKTSQLQKLNESLEIKVEEKLDELRSKDKILEVQSKQAVMGEMISMIAHQWRQPLSTITLQIANLQLRKMMGNKINNEDMEKALEEINGTIVYLSDTVDDFQTYFRKDKKPKKIEVSELLQRAVNLIAPRMQKDAVDITIEVEDNISIFTFVNEFVQVVLNILNNAIDIHEEKNVQNPTIQIVAKQVNDLLQIEITDNAGGILEHYIPKLFEPYFSTKGKNGTGLGLYMSQMIVQKQFNGEISVSSSMGNTTFYIKVPKNIL